MAEDLLQNSNKAFESFKQSDQEFRQQYDERLFTWRQDLEKYNSQWGFLRSQKEKRRLVDEAKELMKLQDTYEDPEDIARTNNRWRKDNITLLNQEGGAFAGELIKTVEELYLLASEKGIRALQDKTKKEASISLGGYDAEFDQAIKMGDLNKAMEVSKERKAFLTTMVGEEIFTDKEHQAFDANSKNKQANALLIKTLQQNQLVELESSRSEALADLKEKKGILKEYFNSADDTIKANFLQRQEALHKSVNQVHLAKEQNEFNNALNSFALGAATIEEVSTAAKTFKNKMYRALKSGTLDDQGKIKINEGIKEINNQLKVFSKFGEAGEALKNNTFDIKNHPLLNPKTELHELTKLMGFTATDNGAQVLASTLKLLPRFKNDSVLTRAAQYEFLMQAIGIDADIPEVQTPQDLQARIAYERRVDKLMGGSGGMSSESAAIFEQFLESSNPAIKGSINKIAADNTGLIPLMAKHRNKPEVRAFTGDTLGFIQRYGTSLNLEKLERH